MRSVLHIFCFVILYSQAMAQSDTTSNPHRDNHHHPYISVTGGLGLPILKFRSPGVGGNSMDFFNYAGRGEALPGLNFNVALGLPLTSGKGIFTCELGYHSNPFDTAAYYSVPQSGASPNLPGSTSGNVGILSKSVGKYSAFNLMAGVCFSTRGKVCSFNFTILGGGAVCSFPKIDYTYIGHIPRTYADSVGSIKVRAQPVLGIALQTGCGLRCFITPKISLLGNINIFYCLADFSFQADQSGGSNDDIHYVGSSTRRDNFSLFNATLGVAYSVGK